MGLFGFGKRKEEGGKTVACACNGACETYEAETVNGSCCDEASNSICCIRVLGSGCKNCHALLENTKAALNNMGLSIQPEYVTDMEKIMAYGVMSMPALVVNEKVVSMGKVLKAADVEKLSISWGTKSGEKESCFYMRPQFLPEPDSRGIREAFCFRCV